MPAPVEKISRGPCFDGEFSYAGLILIVGGIACFAISFLIAIPLIIAGIILFLTYRGILIDHHNGSIMTYENYIFFKAGTWQSLNGFDRITLSISNESQRLNSRGSSKTYRSKTFQIYLSNGNDHKLLLYEFSDLAAARKFLKMYGEKLNKPVYDYIQIAQAQLKN